VHGGRRTEAAGGWPVGLTSRDSGVPGDVVDEQNGHEQPGGEAETPTRRQSQPLPGDQVDPPDAGSAHPRYWRTGTAWHRPQSHLHNSNDNKRRR